MNLWVTVRRVGGSVGLLAGAVVVVASAGSAAAVPRSSAATGATVTYALSPGANPTYIFPMEASANYTVANSETFSYLLWRPLYWFGQGSAPILNPQLSLAYPPVYGDGGRTVSVELKPYVWSDGRPLTAEDVLFWMQLLDQEKANWGAYVPGGFPDNVTRMAVTGPRTIVFHLNRGYSQRWFTYNELSQVTPLPQHAWDRTSMHGPVGNDAATPAGARAVYAFLNRQSTELTTYASNPLWRVVDGPWVLHTFSTLGRCSFVRNPRYSGPQRPGVSTLVELPFTSDAAEFDSLIYGHSIDVGYLPITDLRQAPRLRAAGYRIVKADYWTISFIALNFRNPAVGPVLRQLYVRQALQDLINQPAYIQHILAGYGYPTYGPVPLDPPNPYVSSLEKDNPYPFRPAAAIALLRAHGWNVRPDGVDTCQRPGSATNDCGAGLRRGQPLQFTLVYSSGVTSGSQMVQAIESSWSRAGIQVSIRQAPSNTVFSIATGCIGQSASSSGCRWQMTDDAPGAYSWLYSVDYLPTGGELFGTGGISNEGAYNNATNNANIAATHTEDGLAVLDRYENYLARQLPVLGIPSTAGIIVIANRVHGVTPISSLNDITPESWTVTG